MFFKVLLASCAPVIPRPQWESVLYYTLVVFAFSLIVLAIVLAYFDAARILDQTFYPAITIVTLSKTPVTNNCDGKEGQHHQHVEKISLLRSLRSPNIDKEEGGRVKNSESKGSNHNNAKCGKKNHNNNSSSTSSSSKDSISTKKRKGTANGTLNHHQQQQQHHHPDDSSISDKKDRSLIHGTTHSWASYLRRKFVRRNSSGSDESNIRSGSNNSGAANINKDKQRSSSNSNVSTTTTATNGSSSRKKDDLNHHSREKSDSTASISSVNTNTKKKMTKSCLSTSSSDPGSLTRSSVPPLPDFPSVFDEDRLKNRLKSPSSSSTTTTTTSTSNSSSKTKKNTKNSAPTGSNNSTVLAAAPSHTVGTVQGEMNVVSNGNSSSGSSICNKSVVKMGKPNKKSKKSQGPLKESNRLDGAEAFDSWSSSSNSGEKVSLETSQIWDSPITMFDTEKAMSELVKQTEAFAYHKDIRQDFALNSDDIINGGDWKSESDPFHDFIDSEVAFNYNHLDRMNHHSGRYDVKLNGTDPWDSPDSVWSNDRQLRQQQSSPTTTSATTATMNSFGSSMFDTFVPPSSTHLSQSSLNSITSNNTADKILNDHSPLVTSSAVTDALLDKQISLQSNCRHNWITQHPSLSVLDNSPFFVSSNHHDQSVLSRSRLQEWTRSIQSLDTANSDPMSFLEPSPSSPNWSPSSSVGAFSPSFSKSSVKPPSVISPPISSNTSIDSSLIWRDNDTTEIGSETQDREWNNDAWSYVVAPRSRLKEQDGLIQLGNGDSNTYNDDNLTHSSNFRLFGSSPWNPITTVNSSADNAIASNSAPKIADSNTKVSVSGASATWSQNLLNHPIVSKSPQVGIKNENGDIPINKK